jgi:hypothetical protein
MVERRQARLVLIGLAVVFLLAGCAAGATPTSVPGTPVASADPSVAAGTPVVAATPVPTAVATSAPASVGSGHVIHVRLFVPLASAADMGSACDAAALTATGPVAATIPGSRLQFFDFDQARETEFATMTPLGEQPVPQTGTVVKPINDDPDFSAACLFSFDVPTTADVNKAYMFSLGSVWFPIPAFLRADLEAAGWDANIGVNPQ